MEIRLGGYFNGGYIDCIKCGTSGMGRTRFLAQKVVERMGVEEFH
jgi:hypothetical protein